MAATEAKKMKGSTELKEKLILELFEKNIVKFGNFKLKSGIMSPIYLDIRTVISYPSLLQDIGTLMVELVEDLSYDVICGVPYTALPIGTVMSIQKNIPMVMKRKEKKEYGTKKLIEGVFKSGDRCLVVDDLVTSGMSLFETVGPLKEVGLICEDAVVLVDRQQGGKEHLSNGGINLHSVLTLTEILELLQQKQKITSETVTAVQKFIEESKKKIDGKMEKKTVLTFSQRAEKCENAITKRVFQIMEEKQTNLCCSADVTTMEQLLNLAKSVGPLICILKIHVDILQDFSKEKIKELQEIAKEHNFMIFEDRKFADIGNTMKHQFEGGVYGIAGWADITNAHTLPGDGIFKAFKEAESTCGLLLIAQLSCKGNLITGSYTKKTKELAEKHSDCVIGFICQEKLSDQPDLLHMTPGVNLKVKGDDLGQQYNTPDFVIGEKKSDIIIVGRGIYQAEDPAAAALEYKQQAWDAYQNRCSSSKSVLGKRKRADGDERVTKKTKEN